MIVEFDVTADGATANIRVAETTNECFNEEAMRAVRGWRYVPKISSGAPVERRGVQTQITFELSDGASPDMRPVVGARLQNIQRHLRRDRVDEAQKLLAKLEVDYGDTFTQTELASFHQVRAVARIKMGDLAGAIDDLRVVQRMGTTVENAEVIATTIVQLEAAIAEQERAAAEGAAPPESEDASPPPQSD